MNAAPQAGRHFQQTREDREEYGSDPGARIALATLRDILRRMSRSIGFAPRELRPCAMSRLLCCALASTVQEQSGVSWAGSDGGLDVYVALASGLYRFDPVRLGLHPLSQADIRCQFSTFDGLPAAPLNLVYVSRIDRRVGMRRSHAAALATIRTAAACENVERACAIEGLASTVRGWLDRPSLSAGLGLERDEQLLLVQSIGYAGAD